MVRFVRSVSLSNAIAPSIAARIRTSFFRGYGQKIPKQLRNFSTLFQPWLNLPMQACVRDVVRFDQIFKILLGENGAEHRAISFLNAALRLKADGDRIVGIEFLHTSIGSVNNHTIKIQGLCSTSAGHTFLVEIQKSRIPSFNLWIYDGARELSAMGERFHNERAGPSRDNDGKQKNFYACMTPVKVIVIADFDSPHFQTDVKNSTDFVVDWGLQEMKSHVVASPLLSWTFLVLPRFLAALSASGNCLDFTGRSLEAWLYLMTRKDCEIVQVTKELVANEDAVSQGFHRISHLKSHETASLHDERMALESQSQSWQEYYSQGVAVGLIEGEKKNSMEIAYKLHHLGLPAEQISDITGCSGLDSKKSDHN